MKKIGFLIVALLLTGGMAMAQGPRNGNKMNPKERAEGMTERIAKKDSLNEAQKKDLLEANMAFTEKMANRAEDKKAEMEEVRKEMQNNRDAYDAKLKKILTEEQYAAYSKKQAERQKKMGDRGPRDGQRGNK